jgi:hypothetical protein
MPSIPHRLKLALSPVISEVVDEHLSHILHPHMLHIPSPHRGRFSVYPSRHTQAFLETLRSRIHRTQCTRCCWFPLHLRLDVVAGIHPSPPEGTTVAREKMLSEHRMIQAKLPLGLEVS